MTQKELRAMYLKELETTSTWRGDERMIKHCYNSDGHYVVMLSTGQLVGIEKPSIEKNFCFGYSLSYCDTDSYDRANEMAAHAASSTDYFLKENLKDLDRIIDILEKHHEQYPCYAPTHHWMGDLEECKISYTKFARWYDIVDNNLQEYTEEDRLALLEGYKEVRKKFVKRLETYLKKYGLTKVNTWSYWQDA